VAKVRERLAVNTPGPHKYPMERFSLNEAEGKEKYCVEVSNRFAALEVLNTEVEVNTVWETTKEGIATFQAKRV
jgi:hypothetical protein